MKEFKKIIALLLVVLLVFSLAACGSSDDTNTGDTNTGDTNTGDTNTGDVPTPATTPTLADVAYDEVTVKHRRARRRDQQCLQGPAEVGRAG